MAELSIIVPVYNVEEYLRKCVDSLLAQDYDNYEIILIDDGSTDNSPQICDEYVRMNETIVRDRSRKELENEGVRELGKPFIKVIHRENGGLSAARNSGIEVAQGEYIMFVDSDDYIEPNVLSSLLKRMEDDQLDVLRYDYQNVRIVDSGSIDDRLKMIDEPHLDATHLAYEVFQPYKNPHEVDKREDVVDGVTYLNERMGGYECYATQFLIKRGLIVDGVQCKVYGGDCLFKEGIYFEDTEWTPRMLVRAKRVGSTQAVVYNYFWREGSITKVYNKEHIRKKIDSLYQVNLSLQQLLPQVNDKRWINGCIADNVYGILNNAAAYVYEDRSYWIDRLKEKYMLPLLGYKILKMTMLRYEIINMSPRVYCWLRHIRMKYLR